MIKIQVIFMLMCDIIFEILLFMLLLLYYNKLRENLYEGRRIICTKE